MWPGPGKSRKINAEVMKIRSSEVKKKNPKFEANSNVQNTKHKNEY
jgi:hypothetical protein